MHGRALLNYLIGAEWLDARAELKFPVSLR